MSRRQTGLAKYRRGGKTYPNVNVSSLVYTQLIIHFDANDFNSYYGYYQTPPRWLNLASGGVSYNAELNGNPQPVYVDGVAIQSFRFSRSTIINEIGRMNNYMTYLQPAAMTGDFTYCAWIKSYNGVGTGPDLLNLMYIITNQTSGDTVTTTGFSFGIDDNGKLAYGNTIENTFRSLRSVNSGEWTFVAVTRNSTTGLVSLYINGVLDASYVCNVGELITDTHVIIGSINGSSGRTFGGNIGAILGYSSELTATDMIANFNLLRLGYSNTRSAVGVFRTCMRNSNTFR